eukprot:TRINITY_DN4159_c0_g1_i2.p1 TRINITY_DN4159_c0_g1~~TRINITY_DN4159_c0_g1_i2.p1  ORF type:complete len:1134 (-),score=426.22 TRINITY_DN4159_c0_g1_i2:94-3495(-)
MRALIELKQLRLCDLQENLRVQMNQSSVTKPARFSYRRMASPTVESTLCEAKQSLRFYTPTMLVSDAAESEAESRMNHKQRQRQQAQRQAHRDYLKQVVNHGKNFKEFHKQRRQRDAKLWRQVQAQQNLKARNEKNEKERQEKERLRALKENNEEEYFRLLQNGKNDRLMQLLNQTDSYLQQIGALVKKQQQQINQDMPTPRKKKIKPAEAEAAAEGEASAEAAPAEAEEGAAAEGEDTTEEPAAAAEAPKAAWDFEETQIVVENTDDVDEEFKQLEKELEEIDGADGENGAQGKTALDALKNRKAEYYNIAHGTTEDITAQPTILVGGKLKEYQLQGLKWMVSLYNNNLNGILADEMGLGKTIQTIALLAYLYESKNERGPWLIIVPLSTMSNWSNEFQKWCPELDVVIYKGTPAERKNLMNDKIGEANFHVVLTTYDYSMRDKAQLTKPFKGFRSWKYIIVDEGHRMKNANCKLAQILGTQYTSKNRILLTGTPLQNGIPELWALLNFLLPAIFNSVDNFENWFASPLVNTGEKIELTEEETILIVNRLHQVLSPFLLRRLKSEVMGQLPEKVEKVIKCDLSGWQKKMYQQIKHRGRVAQDPSSGKGGNKSLMNTLMQLRKVVNHPYLFLDEWNIDEDLIRASGKFNMMDNILPKMQRAGHRILLFSQMTSCMDVIEDYFQFREYRFVRLDGATKADDRQERMAQFQSDRSIFIFLLSTRAGGLGLNLQTADTVIIFDSDWNPQMDLQAQDRAHRIGQQAEVRVLRFLTCSAVEEQIHSRATEKLRLDAKVIQAGKFNNKSTNQDRKEALKALLEEDEEEQTEGVASFEQVNEMISRTEEERLLFEQMDHGTAPPHPEFGVFKLPALFGMDQVPEWYESVLVQDEEDSDEEEDQMGRGARRKSEVKYTELSDRQFDKLCREADEPPAAQSEPRSARLKKKRKHESSEEEEEEESDQLGGSLMPVYDAVYKLKDQDGRQVCELFYKLPTRKELPYYYTIISHPIDLHTIHARLAGKKKPYKTISQFQEDMVLMFDNAETFNLEGSEVYNDSLLLREVYEKAIEAVMPQQEKPPKEEDHDEEEAYSPPKKRVLFDVQEPKPLNERPVRKQEPEPSAMEVDQGALSASDSDEEV